MAFSHRKTTYFAIAILFMTAGIEYAVIFPTVWLYLQDRFQAEQYWLGLLIAAFGVSGLIFAPIFGRIADRTKNTKFIILFGNLFMIIGSFLYCLGIAPWFLFISRLIAGIGAAVGGAAIANITWSSAEKDRTPILAVFMAMRQLGLIIGPACNLFLKDINFKMGPFKIDKYSVPGLFVAILTTITQIILIFCYYDLHKLEPTDSSETTAELATESPNESNDIEHDENDGPEHRRRRSSSFGGPGESLWDSSTAELNMIISVGLEDSVEDIPDVNTKSMFNVVRDELLYRPEVTATLFMNFATFFNQGAMESALPPMTQTFYNFGEVENSYLYLGAGVWICLVFILLIFISRKLTDLTILLIGLLIILTTLSWVVIFFPRFKPGDRSSLWIFFTGVFFDIFGLPLLATSSLSLYTKITSQKNQAFMQGLRRSVINLAFILGPLWMGGAVYNLYLFVGVLLGLFCVALILLACSWKQLRHCAEIAKQSQNKNSTSEIEPNSVSA